MSRCLDALFQLCNFYHYRLSARRLLIFISTQEDASLQGVFKFEPGSRFEKSQFTSSGHSRTGCTPGEFESATHLAKKLADDLALPEDEIIRRTHEPNSRRSWVYWEQAASEFGLRMNHFGSRANLRVGDALIVIDFERSQWTVRKSSPMGYREVMRKTGLDSFREFLQQHAPRRYSLGCA